MGEIRREEEIEEPSEYGEHFHQRMEQLVPTFLEIREEMGINENVGFGYLPKVHSEGSSLGSLPDVKRTKQGDIEYSVPGILLQINQEKLSAGDEKNILVLPTKLDRKKRIVSIYDPYEGHWPSDFPPLIDAPDDVFVGLIAHELAHTFNTRSKLPTEIITVLKSRYKEQNSDSKYSWQYDTTDEEEVDLIAALFGYKEQVIAKIDFMIDRTNRRGPYFREKQYVLESLENRKQQVLKYCP